VEDIFLGLWHPRPDKQNLCLEERLRRAHLIPDAQTQALRGSCHQESKLCQFWILTYIVIDAAFEVVAYLHRQNASSGDKNGTVEHQA
jgi:hypothetical protein